MTKIEKGKKALKYKRAVTPAKLMEEIYQAIPELAPKFSESGIKVHLRVFTNGDSLILWVDKKIEESLINEIVKKHKAGEE